MAHGGVLCSRCRRLIIPGSPWDLDHTDDGDGYLGPSHRACNTRAGGAKGNAAQREAEQARREARRRRYVSAAVAVSGARDRAHVSIGIAATVEDENFILIEVVWTKRHGVLTEILDELGLQAVTVDPTSAPAMPPPSGVQLHRPTASEAQLAVPRLLEAVKAGRVRHVPHPRLDEAVKLSGRLGADTSPLRATALAYAALVNITPSV